MYRLLKLVGFSVLLILSLNSLALEQINYLSHGNNDDYFIKVLKLSLDKTADEYGQYQLNFSELMSLDESLKKLGKNTQVNEIRRLMPKARVLKMPNIRHIPFPTQRGVLGYRICYGNKINATKHLSIAESPLFLLGNGWPDADIMRFNGFGVKSIDLSSLNGNNPIQSMYQLSVKDNYYFCRGVNEIAAERKLRKMSPQLAEAQEFMLFYPAPLFFYTHVDNKRLANRVYEGLTRAYKDGSFIKLWNKAYLPKLDIEVMRSKKIHSFASPLLDKVDMAYKRFNYQL